jgi:GDP-L-fucose synthase
MQKDSRIYVAGHTGLVGNALVKKLKQQGYKNIQTPYRRHDLTNQMQVAETFHELEPEYVFVAAAKVGGIVSNNDNPADFGYINGMIALNMLQMAKNFRVKKLLFLGSSCIYPREAPQPMKEEHLLSGPLEKTNELYALAKIFGLKLCQAYNRQYQTNFISCMPTNLYGEHDNFNLTNSHVLPGLMHKIHLAKIRGDKSFTVWGDGESKREFLHVDDFAEACLHLMCNYNENETINVGTGVDLKIKELVTILKQEIGFEGEIVWDLSKPNGTPRKLLDVSRIRDSGWSSKIELREGIRRTYAWFCENYQTTKR